MILLEIIALFAITGLGVLMSLLAWAALRLTYGAGWALLGYSVGVTLTCWILLELSTAVS